MYDLTSFLTTISAGSASFVAILGGLIAQKVIDINNERTAVEEEIKELQERKILLEDEIANREDWMEEDNAISFIGRHPKELLQGEDFSKAADLEDMSGYEDLESLDAYWKKAQKVLAQYAEEVDKPYYNLVKAVQKVITDADISEAFITSICEIIKDHFRAYYHNDGLTTTSQFIVTPAALSKINGYGVSEATYQQWANEKSKIEVELNAVELQIKQFEDRKRRLNVPKEMKKGFWIFGLFIACCVLLPLVLTPFVTENYLGFMVVKIIGLLVFGVGLFSVLNLYHETAAKDEIEDMRKFDERYKAPYKL